MSNEILLGLIFSIPVGIITSLLTPLILKLFQNISRKARAKTKDTTKKEYEILKKYYTDKVELSLFFVSVIIKTTLISAMMSILSYLFFISSQIFYTIIERIDLYFVFNIPTILAAVGQFILLIGSILIVNMCRSAINVWKKIENFAEYERLLKAKEIIL
jgi:hypothetical protein